MGTIAKAARVIAIALSIVIGLGMILIAATLGDCSAFGGRCPADPQPLLDDDTFGTAAFGAALAVGVPTFLWAPSWRRAGIAAVAAAVAGLVIGLAVRSSANS